MIRLIRELRRREVFGTVGLYVGVCWILIEAASSVLLPAFGAPSWVLPSLVLTTIIGFPIVALLAWFYDVTDSGIDLDANESDHPVAGLGQRKMDFVVIAVLALALSFSIYLNFANAPAASRAQLAPVSLLIGPFDNRTEEPDLGDVFEHALAVGIETAPYALARERRGSASGAAGPIAEPVAADLVLSGSIERDGSGFLLELAGLEPGSDAAAFSISATARSRDELFMAVARLADAVREQLAGRIGHRDAGGAAEAFSAASIEAAAAFVRAIDLAEDGRHDAAAEEFETAMQLDPGLGRAVAGRALSEYRLGHEAEAEELWAQASVLLGTMTARERLTFLALHSEVTGRDVEAFARFSELVAAYPADADGRAGLARSAFAVLDFEKAVAEAAEFLELVPDSRRYASDFAIYALYAGDFDVAAMRARAVLAEDPGHVTAHVVLAATLLVTEDLEGAREVYEQLAGAASDDAVSLGMLGLADLSIYLGQFDRARGTLEQGIQRDLERGAQVAAAVKYVALAEAFVGSGETADARNALASALAASDQDAVKIGAALAFLSLEDTESATAIADELSTRKRPNARAERAYALMIQAAAHRQSGRLVEAIDLLRSAADLADLWRVRYELGRAYLDIGMFVAAVDEFQRCRRRRGEATAMFLDQRPTFRYTVDLPYWLALAEDSLGKPIG